jgi:glycine/D-amino acid oxidase-like deaminating enzyme
VSDAAGALPTQARLVVVGGGAVGCAAAYALAKAGVSDVLLVEREAALAGVTTAKAAGLVGQVRSSPDRVRLAMHSVATFSELEREGGQRPGWRQVGSLRVAETAARVDEFRRLQAACRAAGLDTETLSAAAAGRLWPGMDFSAAKAVLWCASDGYVQPYDLCMAYRERARARGARVATGVPVTGIEVKRGRVVAVATQKGRVACETVVDAAGAHAAHVARLAGLELPIVPVRHQYFVTVPLEGPSPELPCFRFPDSTLYGRAEMRGLLLGGWEAQPVEADPKGFALAEEAPPIADDWPVLAGFADKLARFFPAVRAAGVRQVFSGWPTFTPDGRFVVGESRRVKGFVMAGGCNAHGVSGSAGIGRLLVEAMLEKNPGAYVRSLSPDRFTESAWSWDEARAKARAVYATYYHVGH